MTTFYSSWFSCRSIGLALTCVMMADSAELSQPRAHAGSRNTASGATSGAETEVAFDKAFASDRVLDVALDLRREDWDKLRSEGRTLNRIYSGCVEPYEYSLVPAEASFDGRAHGPVKVRKKGLLGSLSNTRPSLRLELGDEHFRGRAELTLNNNRSDPALMRQCLAYRVFAEAGLPAPHCAFAKVRVNGQPLGTYTNVEPVKRGLLTRFFGSADGNLYEGSAIADFRVGMLEHFERKNHRKHPQRDELEAVAKALEIADNDEMVAALDSLIDLDSYIRFWATEMLVGHWDSQPGNSNNFYVYRDPRSSKLQFIPWGTDEAFGKHALLGPAGRPPVTLAHSRLPRRLYAYAPTRQRYYAQLRDLLEHVWNERRLHSEIDHVSALLAGDANPAAVEALHALVDKQRGEIEHELSAELVPWSIAERRVAECTSQYTSKITGSFAATWDSLGAPVVKAPGSAFEVDVNLEHRSMRGPSSAGLMPENGRHAVRVIGRLADGRYLVAHFELPTLPQTAPSDVPLHGIETMGMLVVSDMSGKTYTTLGYIGTGSIHFDQVPGKDDAELSGSFDALFSQVAALPLLQP